MTNAISEVIFKIENAKTDKANDRISFSYYKR